MTELPGVVFVIDDDASMRAALEDLLNSVRLDVHLFSSPDVSEGAREIRDRTSGDFYHGSRGYSDECEGYESGGGGVPHQALPRAGPAFGARTRQSRHHPALHPPSKG